MNAAETCDADSKHAAPYTSGLVAVVLPVVPKVQHTDRVLWMRYHPHMTIDMKSLAREGAKARLWQLDIEKHHLLRAFPDLRDGASSRVTSQEGSHRGRRQMTAAERRSVSVRMKKYWAERRQKNNSPKRGPGRPKALGKRKGISAAGRAAIAAAQKKRWATLRKEGKTKGGAVGNG